MNAISSTCSAMLGKISETQAPDWPCCANLNGDFISGPTWSVKKPVFLSKPVELLAVALLQLGLVVPGVDLARPAVHEQPDDALGLGREVRSTAGPAGLRPGCRRGRTADEKHPLLLQQRSQRQQPAAGAGPCQELRRRADRRGGAVPNRCGEVHGVLVARI